jgi:hypothetical protein
MVEGKLENNTLTVAKVKMVEEEGQRRHVSTRKKTGFSRIDTDLVLVRVNRCGHRGALVLAGPLGVTICMQET